MKQTKKQREKERENKPSSPLKETNPLLREKEEQDKQAKKRGGGKEAKRKENSFQWRLIETPESP